VQFFHVVRDLAVQKTDAIISGQTNPPAKTQIKNACIFAERFVFGQPVAIIRDDFCAIQFSELCAEMVMKFVQDQ
jgi:hypothetical protein